MNEVEFWQTVAIAEGALLVVMLCALSFYKGYYDKKQENLKLLAGLRKETEQR